MAFLLETAMQSESSERGSFGMGIGNILIADTEPGYLDALSAMLSDEGYIVFGSSDGGRAMDILGTEKIDAVITDLKTPATNGVQLFEYVLRNYPDIPLIFLTTFGTVEAAVQALTNGAFYYFIKPPDYVRLKGILARAVEQRRLKQELWLLKGRLTAENHRQPVGGSPRMLRVFETLNSVRDSSSPVLIRGESGTGKELIARTLHSSGFRRDMPFISVNCAVLPGELVESELFGYEKGAPTEAVVRRPGKFEAASSGTLFVDEVGGLGLPLQAKLLRVLEEMEVERLGGSRKVKVKFRLICSTSCQLEREVEQGSFIADLFYRISVVDIKLPPLRERKSDLPLLVSEFVKEFGAREDKSLSVSEEVVRVFQRYDWPGNIRQLRNILERAVVLARGGSISLRDLPEELVNFKKRFLSGSPLKTLREVEIQAVKNALSRCSGNKSRAAQMLGISRKAFYKKLREV
jgi:DNA-binding NtrC family response regulator